MAFLAIASVGGAPFQRIADWQVITRKPGPILGDPVCGSAQAEVGRVARYRHCNRVFLNCQRCDRGRGKCCRAKCPKEARQTRWRVGSRAHQRTPKGKTDGSLHGEPGKRAATIHAGQSAFAGVARVRDMFALPRASRDGTIGCRRLPDCVGTLARQPARALGATRPQLGALLFVSRAQGAKGPPGWRVRALLSETIST